MSSRLIHIVACVGISFFLWPNNISLCVCSTFCLSIYPLRDPGLWAPLGHRDLHCSGCGVRWESDRGLQRIGLSGWFLSTQVQLPIRATRNTCAWGQFRSAGRGLRGAVASCGLPLLQGFTIQESPTRVETLRSPVRLRVTSSASWVWGGTCWAGVCRGFLGLALPLPEIRMTLGCCRSRVWRASSVREDKTVRFPEPAQCGGERLGTVSVYPSC